MPRELWGTAGEVLVLVLTPLGHSLAEPPMGLRPRRVDRSRGRALSPAGTRRCPKPCAWQPPCASCPEGRPWLVFSEIWRGGVGARGTWAVAVPFSCGCCCATQESFPPCSAPGSNGNEPWCRQLGPLPCIPMGPGKEGSGGTPHPSELAPIGVRSRDQHRVPRPFRAGWLSFAPGPAKSPWGLHGSILGWGLLLYPLPPSFSSALRAPSCLAGPCARVRAPGSLGSPAGFANSVALVCLKSVARAKSLIASSLAPSSRTSAGPRWRGFAAGELRRWQRARRAGSARRGRRDYRGGPG